MGTVYTSRASQPEQPVLYERSQPDVAEREVDVVFRDAALVKPDPLVVEAFRIFASKYTEIASELFEDDRDLTNSIEPSELHCR